MGAQRVPRHGRRSEPERAAVAAERTSGQELASLAAEPAAAESATARPDDPPPAGAPASAGPARAASPQSPQSSRSSRPERAGTVAAGGPAGQELAAVAGQRAAAQLTAALAAGRAAEPATAAAPAAAPPGQPATAGRPASLDWPAAARKPAQLRRLRAEHGQPASDNWRAHSPSGELHRADHQGRLHRFRRRAGPLPALRLACLPVVPAGADRLPPARPRPGHRAHAHRPRGRQPGLAVQR